MSAVGHKTDLCERFLEGAARRLQGAETRRNPAKPAARGLRQDLQAPPARPLLGAGGAEDLGARSWTSALVGIVDLAGLATGLTRSRMTQSGSPCSWITAINAAPPAAIQIRHTARRGIEMCRLRCVREASAS